MRSELFGERGQDHGWLEMQMQAPSSSSVSPPRDWFSISPYNDVLPGAIKTSYHGLKNLKTMSTKKPFLFVNCVTRMLC